MYRVWPVWIGSTIPAAVWLHPRLNTVTVQDLLTVFFFHWVVITLTLILRDLHRLQQGTESLEQRWAQEIKKRESKRRDRRRPSERRSQKKK